MNISRKLSNDLNDNRTTCIKPINLSEIDQIKFQKILHHDKRTLDGAKILYERLKELGFFNKFYKDSNFDELDDDAMIYLCKKMKYEKYNAGTFIFREGDPSNGKVYIVYSGCVLVIIKQEANVYVKENQEIKKKLEFDTNQNGLLRSGSNLIRSGSQSIQSKNSLNSTLSSRMNSINSEKLKKFMPYKKLIHALSLMNLKKRKYQGSSTSHHHLGEAPINTSHTNNNIQIGNAHIGIISTNNLVTAREEQIIDDIAKETGIIKDKIFAGDIFGEIALTADTCRGASILTNTECEFLIITAQDFRMVKEHFDKTKNVKREFLMRYFPDMKNVNSGHIIDDYVYNLREESYKLDKVIIEEGKLGENIYVIFGGVCEILKSVIFKENNANELISSKKYKKIIPICQIGCGAFFGEEILDDNNDSGLYEYTVKVISSNANLFSIKKSLFLQRFPKPCTDGVREIYYKKKNYNEKVLTDVIKSQFKGLVIDHEVIEHKDNMKLARSSTPKINLRNNIILANEEKRSIQNEGISLEKNNLELISNEPIILAYSDNILKNQTLESFTKTNGLSSRSTKKSFNPFYIMSLQACSNIKSENRHDDNNDDIESKNLHLKLNNRHRLKLNEELSAVLNLKKMLNPKKIIGRSQFKLKSQNDATNNAQPEERKIQKVHDSPINSLESGEKTKNLSKVQLNDLSKPSFDSSIAGSARLPSKTTLPSQNIIFVEKTHCQGSHSKLLLEFDSPYNPSSCKDLKKNQTSGRQNSVIRSRINKSEDMRNYFKNLEQNFSCLGDKIRKNNDEAYICDIDNFKMNLGNSYDQDIKSQKPNNNNDAIQSVYKKQPHIKFSLEKYLKIKHEKRKKKFENRFSIGGPEKITMRYNHDPHDYQHSRDSLVPTPSMKNNNLSCNNMTKMITPVTPSSLRLHDDFKNSVTKSDDIKSYLIKVKKDKLHESKDSQMDISRRDNISNPLATPLSAKSTEYAPYTSISLTNNNNNTNISSNPRHIITSDKILKWKHQRYLSLTSRKKEKSKIIDTNANARISTGSGISFRAKPNQIPQYFKYFS